MGSEVQHFFEGMRATEIGVGGSFFVIGMIVGWKMFAFTLSGSEKWRTSRIDYLLRRIGLSLGFGVLAAVGGLFALGVW